MEIQNRHRQNRFLFRCAFCGAEDHKLGAGGAFTDRCDASVRQHAHALPLPVGHAACCPVEQLFRLSALRIQAVIGVGDAEAELARLAAAGEAADEIVVSGDLLGALLFRVQHPEDREGTAVAGANDRAVARADKTDQFLCEGKCVFQLEALRVEHIDVIALAVTAVAREPFMDAQKELSLLAADHAGRRQRVASAADLVRFEGRERVQRDRSQRRAVCPDVAEEAALLRLLSAAEVVFDDPKGVIPACADLLEKDPAVGLACLQPALRLIGHDLTVSVQIGLYDHRAVHQVLFRPLGLDSLGRGVFQDTVGGEVQRLAVGAHRAGHPIEAVVLQREEGGLPERGGASRRSCGSAGAQGGRFGSIACRLCAAARQQGEAEQKRQHFRQGVFRSFLCVHHGFPVLKAAAAQAAFLLSVKGNSAAFRR